MNLITKWSSFVKLSHTLFSLPFALIGFGYAYIEKPSGSFLINLGWMVLAVFFARNAAMAFNRYIDRDIDKKNNRTVTREIPSNIISPEKAIVFVFVNVFLFILTAYIINPLAFYLSPVAIAVVIGYSFSKRFTWLSHYILGLALGIAPVGAYLVIAQQIDFLPILLSIAVFFWVAGFDILYALQDEDFDREQGLHSIPEHFGRNKALIISTISHIIALVFLVIFGFYVGGSWVYWTGFSSFLMILTYEHIIVKPNDISKINTAFATLNAIGSVIFAFFTLLDAFHFYIW